MNPEKCTFRVPWGKLLRYIIIEHGIEANPNKISASAEMGQKVREVQLVSTAMLHPIIK
jgi:hypothetical protein